MTMPINIPPDYFTNPNRGIVHGPLLILIIHNIVVLIVIFVLVLVLQGIV